MNQSLLIEVVPATKRFVQNGMQLNKQQGMRVAAYCRVSTGDESQQTSYTKQKEYYSSYIQSVEGWIFAGIYADEALSGTSRKRRVEFNRMMEDALSGKIDYIMTKSISRFARNTVDTLECVRQLRQQNPPVGIFFEKEHVDTLDAKGELLLTILSAMAQDESRSISDNIRWTIQKKFQEGIPQINLKRMLGYELGADGTWLIVPEQAEIVQYIFQQYVKGISANRIAKKLNEMQKTTVNGNRWRSDGVLDILRNEKFVGDLEMQKHITKDFLTHKATKNQGEMPKYYVTNHHEGIIDRLTWNCVQGILQQKQERRNVQGTKRGDVPIFSNVKWEKNVGEKVVQYPMRRMTYHQTGKENQELQNYIVWRCDDTNMTEKLPIIKGRNNNHRMDYVIEEKVLKESYRNLLKSLKETKKRESLEQQFELAYKKICDKEQKTQYSITRLHVLEMEIQEMEKQNSENVNLKEQLQMLKREKQILEAEQSSAIIVKKNYTFFLKCIEQNDFSDFPKGMYFTFIEGGVIKENAITYQTNFGITFLCQLNPPLCLAIQKT